MKNNLSKMLFEDIDPAGVLQTYIKEDFQASNTGSNIEPVDDKEEEDTGSSEEDLASSIENVLEKHKEKKNESFFSLYSLISEENKSISSESEPEETEKDDETSGDATKDKETKAKPGQEIDDSVLISDDSASDAELKKAVPIILNRIKSDDRVKKMISDLSKFDPENLKEDEEEELQKYVEQIISDDKGLGLMDLKTLRKLFQTPVTVGSLGKSILNPMQAKKGSEQILGVTSNDLNIYKKLKMIPFFLTTKSAQGDIETVSGHKGKENFYVVFVAPAFGAIIQDQEDLNNYQAIFRNFSRETELDIGDIIQDCNELPYIYVKGEKELEALQSNFVRTFSRLLDVKDSRKGDGKESEPIEADSEKNDSEQGKESAGESEKQEITSAVRENNFIYKSGLSNLLNEENLAFPAKKYVTTIVDKSEKGQDGEERKKRDVDPERIKEESRAITYQAYKRFLKIARKEYEEKKNQEGMKKAQDTYEAIEGASSVGQGAVNSYLGFMAAGVMTKAVTFTAAGASLAVLPYLIGAKIATPAISKGVGLAIKGYKKHQQRKDNKLFQSKAIDDQIKEMLVSYFQTGEYFSGRNDADNIQKTKHPKLSFDSVDSECLKLEKSINTVLELIVKDDNDDKNKKDQVVITHTDFETSCNKNKYQLTQVNEIPQDVYQNFMIDCNDLLRQSKVEIKGISRLSSSRKMGDGFYDENEGQSQDSNDKMSSEVQDMSPQERIKLFKEVVEQIPEDNDRTRLIKAAILAKLASGDEKAAHEYFQRIIDDPDSFTASVEKALDEDASEEETLKDLSETTGVSEEKIKQKASDLCTFFITPKEVKVLKDLDRNIAASFGIDGSAYSSLPKKFNLKASGAYKIIAYTSRNKIDDQYKKLPNLTRPNIQSIRNSFAFPEAIKSIVSDEEIIERINAFLFNVVSNVIYADNMFSKEEILEYVDIATKDLEEKQKTKLKDSFEKVYKYIYRKSLYDQIQQYQSESKMVLESVYYDKSLSSLLFENDLKDLKFK